MQRKRDTDTHTQRKQPIPTTVVEMMKPRNKTETRIVIWYARMESSLEYWEWVRTSDSSCDIVYMDLRGTWAINGSFLYTTTRMMMTSTRYRSSGICHDIVGPLCVPGTRQQRHRMPPSALPKCPSNSASAVLSSCSSAPKQSSSRLCPPCRYTHQHNRPIQMIFLCWSAPWECEGFRTRVQCDRMNGLEKFLLDLCKVLFLLTLKTVLPYADMTTLNLCNCRQTVKAPIVRSSHE